MCPFRLLFFIYWTLFALLNSPLNLKSSKNISKENSFKLKSRWFFWPHISSLGAQNIGHQKLIMSKRFKDNFGMGKNAHNKRWNRNAVLVHAKAHSQAFRHTGHFFHIQLCDFSFISKLCTSCFFLKYFNNYVFQGTQTIKSLRTTHGLRFALVRLSWTCLHFVCRLRPVLI